MEWRPKTLQIVLDVNEWDAFYTCKIPVQPFPETESAVGVDVGTCSFAITSDGVFVQNPRHLGRSLKKLRFQQRTVSRGTHAATARTR